MQKGKSVTFLHANCMFFSLSLEECMHAHFCTHLRVHRMAFLCYIFLQKQARNENARNVILYSMESFPPFYLYALLSLAPSQPFISLPLLFLSHFEINSCLSLVRVTPHIAEAAQCFQVVVRKTLKA